MGLSHPALVKIACWSRQAFAIASLSKMASASAFVGSTRVLGWSSRYFRRRKSVTEPSTGRMQSSRVTPPALECVKMRKCSRVLRDFANAFVMARPLICPVTFPSSLFLSSAKPIWHNFGNDSRIMASVLVCSKDSRSVTNVTELTSP